MKQFLPLTRAAAAAVGLLCLVANGPCSGADAGGAEVSELKRAIEELRAQNRALANRLSTLEAQHPAAGSTATAATPATPTASAIADEALARRVQELEITRSAKDDATRAIIRDSLAKVGSKVNEAVSMGGAIEMLLGRSRDFSGAAKSTLQLNTAEVDFDIQASPWATANFKIGYTDGSSHKFVNTAGFESAVDRLTVEAASITVGDVQRFPMYLRAGLMNLSFGSSTGTHRADVLSIESPLTTEAFESRRPAIGFGFGLPTPALRRPDLPVIAPPVRPQVLGPLVARLARQLGYSAPPERLKAPTPVSLPAEPPPFYGSLLFYEGHNIGGQRSFTRNTNARVGYRAGGHCGRRYSDLRSRDFCPWSMDISLDYNSSVFDGKFLAAEYRPFLDSFGPVRGLASTLKLALGPVSVVSEWNGAIGRAEFTDDAGKLVSIKPSAWQVALGYQFDWNPWIEAIGSQGTYIALGYSQSRDLAGVTQLVNTLPSRVGFLPRRRWTLTAGEWLHEGLKVQVEYSRATDYAIDQGGTGGGASAIQMTLTYAW